MSLSPSVDVPVDRAAAPGTPPAARSRIDPRGARFAAAVTSVVLAVTLISGCGWLLAAQAVVFAVGAFAGLRFSPYSLVFKALVRPRIGPPRETEDEAPPRFAQAVGLAFAVIGTAGYLGGVPVLGAVATGFALVAALLNATVGLCLGCELYLTYKRLTSPRDIPPHIPTEGASA